MWSLDSYNRYDFDLNGNVSITVSKAKEYLADNQPGPAALVLDALTVMLLPADNERYIDNGFIVGNAMCSYVIYTRISTIDYCMFTVI